MGFNQRKPPDRMICVAVDLSAAFDEVCHNNLRSKINRSQLPLATARWLSCYLRGRQTKTCFRGIKSTSRKVNTGVPQGSKLSPSFFSFYMTDMPRPTEPVKRVCYDDDLTVWTTGVKIPDLYVSINSYLETEGQLLVELCPKVYNYVVQSGSTTSQDPFENTRWGLAATTNPMSKDIRSLPRHLPIIQQA